jgi:hypothetical protein
VLHQFHPPAHFVPVHQVLLHQCHSLFCRSFLGGVWRCAPREKVRLLWAPKSTWLQVEGERLNAPSSVSAVRALEPGRPDRAGRAIVTWLSGSGRAHLWELGVGENNGTKMDVKEIGCEVVNWIRLAQDRDQWRGIS